jgi:hypothetical protein
MAQRRDARAVDEYTAHCHQQFLVQIAFAGDGGIWIETTGSRVLPSFLSK